MCTGSTNSLSEDNKAGTPIAFAYEKLNLWALNRLSCQKKKKKNKKQEWNIIMIGGLNCSTVSPSATNIMSLYRSQRSASRSDILWTGVS